MYLIYEKITIIPRLQPFPGLLSLLTESIVFQYSKGSIPHKHRQIHYRLQIIS